MCIVYDDKYSFSSTLDTNIEAGAAGEGLKVEILLGTEEGCWKRDVIEELCGGRNDIKHLQYSIQLNGSR